MPSEGSQRRCGVRDAARVAVSVRKLLCENPFQPRIFQTLAALTALTVPATDLPAFTHRLGGILRATSRPLPGNIPHTPQPVHESTQRLIVPSFTPQMGTVVTGGHSRDWCTPSLSAGAFPISTQARGGL